MSAALPPRFTEIKRTIAAANPNFEQDLTKAWIEVLAELDKVTKVIAKEGSSVRCPEFSPKFMLLIYRPERSTFLKYLLLSWTS